MSGDPQGHSISVALQVQLYIHTACIYWWSLLRGDWGGGVLEPEAPSLTLTSWSLLIQAVCHSVQSLQWDSRLVDTEQIHHTVGGLVLGETTLPYLRLYYILFAVESLVIACWLQYLQNMSIYVAFRCMVSNRWPQKLVDLKILN